mgnify:CR=1 FL=1
MGAARGSGVGADADMNADAEVNTSFKISCPFAFENPYVENAEAHDGVDFVADRGTPVLAAADGKVRTAAFSASLGNYWERMEVRALPWGLAKAWSCRLGCLMQSMGQRFHFVFVG